MKHNKKSNQSSISPFKNSMQKMKISSVFLTFPFFFNHEMQIAVGKRLIDLNGRHSSYFMF